MRGRKPKADAVRRGRTAAGELARAERAEVVPDVLGGVAEKPDLVREVPTLSRMWDALVGDGSAYVPQDVPLLTSWVFYTELASQLMERSIGEDGETIDTIALAREDGSVKVKEGPYARQLRDATSMAMKLAEHFGGTPMARARLGLTRAATASIGEDIQRKIIKAMERSAKKGR